MEKEIQIGFRGEEQEENEENEDEDANRRAKGKELSST